MSHDTTNTNGQQPLTVQSVLAHTDALIADLRAMGWMGEHSPLLELERLRSELERGEHDHHVDRLHGRTA